MPHTEVPPAASDITQLIGHTPLIELSRLADKNLPDVLVKHEGFNPGGSIRDRTVLEILDNAFASGLLRSGDEVVVAGATNSAVATCVIAHARGCSVTVFHPSSGPKRLLGLLQRAGARLVCTEDENGLEDTVVTAADYARQRFGRIFIDAGRREALQDAVRQIGREIIEALDGQPVGAFITSYSTGSTLRTVSRELRIQYPELAVVGIKIDTPPDRKGVYDDVAHSLVDHDSNSALGITTLQISESQAWRAHSLLARTEGLLLGPKGAAAALTALRIRSDISAERAIVSLSIDGGQRYLGAEPPQVHDALERIADYTNHDQALTAMRALIQE